MKKILYPKQREIAEFINKFKEVNDCWPTLSELRYSFPISNYNLIVMEKKGIIEIKRRKFSIHKTVVALEINREYKLSEQEQKVIDFLKSRVASFTQMCEAKVIKTKSSSNLYVLVGAGLISKIHEGTYELSQEGRKYVNQ